MTCSSTGALARPGKVAETDLWLERIAFDIEYGRSLYYKPPVVEQYHEDRLQSFKFDGGIVSLERTSIEEVCKPPLDQLCWTCVLGFMRSPIAYVPRALGSAPHEILFLKELRVPLSDI